MNCACSFCWYLYQYPTIVTVVGRSYVLWLCFLKEQSFILPSLDAHQRSAPSLNLINTLDISPISPVILRGEKKSKIWLEFRPQSPLTCSGCETNQRMGNLKHSLGSPMIVLCRPRFDVVPSTCLQRVTGQIPVPEKGGGKSGKVCNNSELYFAQLR